MSTTEWTNPNTGKGYPIGTIGFEYNNPIFKAFDFALDAARKIFPGATAYNLLFGAKEGNGAWCPTYGSWAGPGWASGHRYSTAEDDKIDWKTPPCYNESIRGIETNPNLNPESCISLVDAITKTHDWMYTLVRSSLFDSTNY